MIELLLLAGGLGLATWVAGWWTIVAGAALWAYLRPGGPWRAGLAAALAWAGLLAFTLPPAPLLRLAPRIGGLLGVPGWAAVLLTLAYAGLLGWSTARVTRAVALGHPRPTS